MCVISAPFDLVSAAPTGCVTDGAFAQLGRNGLVATDVTGDGYADAVAGAGYDGVYVVEGPLVGDHLLADVAWAFVEQPDYGGLYHSGVTPDRDGDGTSEILVSASSTVWAVSAREGSWSVADGVVLWNARTGDVPSVLGGDFDGDGSGDVAITAQDASYDAEAYTGVTTLLWGL